jgi:hypothetical protein
MGDRGNIAVINKKYGTDDYEGIWLYSHWGGYRLEATARKAVENSGRIGDPSYLTRIIFCNMIADSFQDGEGKSGSELIQQQKETGELDSDGFFESVVDEFMGELGYGIGIQGAGDQNYPTVVVDADTGNIWLDHKCPTTVKQIIANLVDTIVKV